MRGEALWEHVANHWNYHCFDTRDHVFSLLSLSLNNDIDPDYTKSSFQVLLQLLWQKGCSSQGANDLEYAMTRSLNIISAFHLGPLDAEIADILQLRRLAHAFTRLGPRDLVFDEQEQCPIVLHTDLCCKIWEDGAGNLVTSLLEGRPPTARTWDDNFEYVEQFSKDVAVKLRNPLGKVVALADKKVKCGDILLFFRDFGPPSRIYYTLGPPVAGRILRPTECGIHVIVGQVVVDHGITPAPSEHHCPHHTKATSAATDSLGFELKNNNWRVLMSHVDFLLFAAQDMRSEVSPHVEGVSPVIKRTFGLGQTARRLTTSVTTDLNSSYAFRQEDWVGLDPPGYNTPFVLHSDLIDFPDIYRYTRDCAGRREGVG
jgi:hypothetical protein